jgi:hypothetical protein
MTLKLDNLSDFWVVLKLTIHKPDDFNTVSIRKPDCLVLSNSILCKSRPFDSRTIQKTGQKSAVASLDRFKRKEL